MIPLIIVEMAHGSAVTPPKVYLYAQDIIATGIPTTGPRNKPLIITIRHLMLAGVPLTFTETYEAKIPIIANIAKQTI